MPVQITITGVPEDVRNELATRAAVQRLSMQQYLRNELQRIASKPTLTSWLQDLRKRKAESGNRVPAAEILRARDADRR